MSFLDIKISKDNDIHDFKFTVNRPLSELLPTLEASS